MDTSFYHYKDLQFDQIFVQYILIFSHAINEHITGLKMLFFIFFIHVVPVKDLLNLIVVGNP